MRIFFTDRFVLPLPPGHRFPMAKYRLLRERVEAARLGDLAEPPAASDEQLALAHDPAYVARVTAGPLDDLEQRRIGFPWSPELIERSRRSVGATIEAARAALREGVAVNIAGGTHHAGPDWGAGYCVFNDAAVAARTVQAEGRAARVLIVDCDVHQGNGTSAIFAGDDSVFTFSVHGERNFPFRKVDGDLDLALPDGTGDDEYLALLDQGLLRATARARADLAIYVTGADPWKGDRLGRLALTKDGLRRRDELVLRHLREGPLPVAITMGGGYAPDIADSVDIHEATVRAARACFGLRSVVS
ncbi:MAG: histone deacetylase family protein [Planctomycetota bacterium]